MAIVDMMDYHEVSELKEIRGMKEKQGRMSFQDTKKTCPSPFVFE